MALAVVQAPFSIAQENANTCRKCSAINNQFELECNILDKFYLIHSAAERCIGKFEAWSCVNPYVGCSDSCDDRKKNGPQCLQKLSCYGMSCVCINGYARDEHSNCVPIDKCGMNYNCPPNEFYSTCKSSCFSDACGLDIVLRNQNCEDGCQGEAGCTCEIGFARDQTTNKCVRQLDCRQCTKSNAVLPFFPN